MNNKRPIRESFELRHEVVLNQGVTSVGIPVALAGGAIVAVGFAFHFACNVQGGGMGNLLFLLAIGVPPFLWGIYAHCSSMEREMVSIRGAPLQVHVCRFRAPRGIAFDAPRARVLQEGRYSATDIEWISVDLDTTPTDGKEPQKSRHWYYYWHTIIKPKDLPPKKLGTFCAYKRDSNELFKDALEEAGALGRKVARALQVPFLWDECPAFKKDPKFAARLHQNLSKQGWPWPWSVGTKAAAPLVQIIE